VPKLGIDNENGAVCSRNRILAPHTLYPAFVLLVVVATGNHFFLDAAAGALVAALALAAASLLTRAAATNAPTALPVCDVLAPSEELAAYGRVE